ncbi:unnamed protein product [Phytophthora fragariaefolia]|uniref:Unnamed protein product n=1 Tax=Phytophthora fragariaefolia TaxID=1490495 RepID=A0A9W7D6W2_9STRA|nr:unnamed protein product [Phytophthora fragariaefolia]
MNYFLLTNPNARLNSLSRPSSTVAPLGPRGFPQKSGRVGPTRPRKSKNCANAKKAEANAKNRRRQLEKVAKHATVELQRQIHQLHRQLTLMNERTVQLRQRSQDAAYLRMKEYFRHIQRGMNPTRRPIEALATKNFLLANFADDMKSPDYTGLGKFIEQWQLLSESHADLGCQVSRMEVNFLDQHHRDRDDDVRRFVSVVKTYGATTLQISRTTIEQVFPHVLNDEELVQRLIGKTYNFSFTLIAYVDASTGRVFQIESKVDLTSALLNLLQDPFITIRMVEATTMSKHGNLLLTTDVHEVGNIIENSFL